ncbi:uncharacterized protein ACLA_091040 [Aspergillus clavatus NRRL 1]|uniref:Uncharacterized protein n=1 Tax=Aspergillus clavatus (strain ATCC 1007 / CBS 513.65 / DSM 816 / NCTC 3887 / NRRL 1 / QM 1276 / 107) TaxID=344612 RepID=A1CEV7_ASPCL|nr:uncharacterized protein ACLA_091040 [Aspergillus clavatus NRRL 1]EAW11406.1 conserved hypothetical protein [Aspergillus clavatus NRRL 1]
MSGVDVPRASHASPELTVGQSRKSLSPKTNVNSQADCDTTTTIPPVMPDHDGHRSSEALAATAPNLPLTPPRAGREKTPPHPASGMHSAPSSHSIHYNLNGAGTPTKPSHPPTPETTPPRTTPSTDRPSLSQFGRVSFSSRAESFQTAREMISDSETITPYRSSQSLRRQRRHQPRTRRSSRSNSPAGSSNPSLSDDASTLTPSSETVRFLKPDRYEGNNGMLCDRESASARPERSRGRSLSKDDGEEVHPVRGRRLREQVQDAQEDLASQSSLEYFGITIGWPSAEEESQRLSGVSTSSTIEVIIIEAPRPANPALRHTEKRSSLRSASSPLARSERTSLETNPEFQHRLVHKAARITEQNRKSMASDMSIPSSSTEGTKQQSLEIIPVVVIPERRSSLRSSPSVTRNPSKPGSRRSSRQRSSSRQKSRPPSRDLPRRKKRTLSDSIATSSSQASDARGHIFGRPVIPPRSSSLSAPTSRDNSRATSLTSVALPNHPPTDPPEMAQRLAGQLNAKPSVHHRGPSSGSRDAADASKTQSIWIGVEDLAGLRPPSLPFTPASIPSSSPGIVEVNEARTVAFFPHTNESLLLVNQPTRPPPPPPVSENRELSRPPQTPEVVSQQDPNQVASPLRNPRPPPKPPVHNANAGSPTHEAGSQPGVAGDHLGSTGQPSRRFGSLRRPWGVRPRSDSFDRFVRSLSITSAKHRAADKDIDSRLHPFWRPRRFWDDSPDSEEFAEQEKAPHPEPEQIINNSLGMPQPRVVFDGPSALAPRSPEMKRPRPGFTLGPHSRSRHSLVGSALFSPEALRSQTSLHQRRILSASWWRLRLRSRARPVRSLRRRLRRTLQEREEARREAQREKLKAKIGDAVLVGCSMQARELARQP